MSLRRFLAVLGAVALIGGAAALFEPVHIDSKDMRGDDISCGAAFSADTGAAWMKDRQAVLAGGTDPGNVADCKSALAARKTWTIPLAIAGGVVLLGALVVRTPARDSSQRNAP